MAPRNNDLRQSTREERAEILLVVKNAFQGTNRTKRGKGDKRLRFQPGSELQLLLRGTLVSRAYGIHKSLHI